MHSPSLVRLVFAVALAAAAALPVRADSTFYVTGSGNNTITRFSGAGVNLGVFPSINLNIPTAIAIDSAGALYVTDDQSASSIEKYGSDGTDLGPFASTNLNRTYGLTFDAAGNLYAANFGNGTIERFSPTGADLGAFVTGVAGPVGMVFDAGGNLLVANYSADTVTRYTSSGSSLGTFASTGLSVPYAMALDSAGNLYVSNSGNNTVRRFSSTGADLGTFCTTGAGPTGLVFDSSGNLFVGNENDANIQMFSATGASLGVFATLAAGSAPAALALRTDNGAFQFAVSSYSVNENAGFVTLNVSRTGTAAASVSYTTSNGSALAGVDYTMTTGTLTWAAGDTAPIPIQVPILDRGLATSNVVTFSVLLSAPTGGTSLGSPSQAVVQITQNDTPVAPALTFSSPPTDLTVTAGAVLPLALSATDPSGSLTRVQFQIDGATVASILAPGPYTFNATTPTTPGTHTVGVTAVSGQTLVYKNQRNLTVVAADPATPSPSAAALVDLNGRLFKAGSELPVTITATSGMAGTPLARVDFYADGALFASLDGSGNPITSAAGPVRPVARDAADNPVNNGSVFTTTFQMPGSTKLVNILAVALDQLGRSQVSAPIAVQSIAGAADQPPVVTLGGLTDGTPVGVNFTVDIPVQVTDPDSPLASRGSRPVTRAFDATPLISKVEYYLNALKVKADEQSGSDVSVTPAAEGTYVVTAVATDAAGLATVSKPLRLRAVTPATVSVAAGGDGIGSEDGKKIKAVFSRTGDASDDLTVLYKLGGTATNKKDYTGLDKLPLPGTFVIPAGSASAKLKIVPKDDAKVEGTEKINLTLLPSPTGVYTLGASIKAKLLILDND